MEGAKVVKIHALPPRHACTQHIYMYTHKRIHALDEVVDVGGGAEVGGDALVHGLRLKVVNGLRA